MSTRLFRTHCARTLAQPRKRHQPALTVESLETRTLLSTFAVDRLTDVGQGTDQAGDLRYCIAHAVDGDQIQFAVQGVVNLTHTLPDLAHNIRIDGPGPDTLTIDGGQRFRIFTIDSPATVEISGLTLARGVSNGITADGRGGGILNLGTLTVVDAVFSGNSATNGTGGGAIYNRGTLTVDQSAFSHNTGPDASGGALYNQGKVTIRDSTFSANQADDGGALKSDSGSMDIATSTFSSNMSFFGGSVLHIAGTSATIDYCTISSNPSSGIRNDGTLSVSFTTISGNQSTGNGGGIENHGTLTVSNSTISGNSALGGGGIANSGMLTVSNSTVSGNSATVGGGIANDTFSTSAVSAVVNSCTIANNVVHGLAPKASQLYSGSHGSGQSTIELRNTIVSGDGSTPNFFAGPSGSFVSDGHNLSSDDGGGSLTGAGDLINTDPMLGPLQDNGGPAQTMALLPGSPAVDAGDNSAAPAFDERGPGFSRTVGGTLDIGAFEAQIGPATHLAIAAAAEVTSGSPFDVTVTALDAYGHIATGYVGTVTFSSTDMDPGVLLPPDTTFTADDQGSHTFQGEVTLITAGMQTLSATDTANNALTANALITVDPATIPPPYSIAGSPLRQMAPAPDASASSLHPGQDTSCVDWLFALPSTNQPAH